MVEEMNKSGKISKNLVNPPLKDNVAVPDAGTVFSKIRKKIAILGSRSFLRKKILTEWNQRVPEED